MNIIEGNCLDVMKEMEEDSIDLLLTDPPYQLNTITKRFGKKNAKPAKYGKDGAFQRVSSGFMGKKWDVLPSVEIWKECLRVLKPGSFAFIMCTPRQDSLSRMIVNLEDAGFITGFSSIYWANAQGFPKAHSISKAIDRKYKAEREVIGYSKGVSVEDNQGFGGIARGGVGIKQKVADIPITAPATNEAKQLVGAYTLSLKPAVEIVIVVMKPLSEKGFVDQALKRLEQEKQILKNMEKELMKQGVNKIEWEE